MKLFIFACGVLVSLSIQAKSLIIGVSPFQSEETHMSQSKVILKHLTELDTGDEAIVFNAYSLEELGRFIIPENKAYASPKARLSKNGKLVKRLLGLVHEPKLSAMPSVNNAVRLPQFLRHIGENYSEQRGDIILVGSPLYDDPKNKLFSMASGLFPSDGHLKVGRDKSVFGTQGATSLLQGWHIHLAYGSNDLFESDRHQYYVQRFWTLFIEAQGGSLVTFAPSVLTALDRAKNNAQALEHQFQKGNTVRLEMIRLRVKETPVPIYERSLSTMTLPALEVKQASHVEIGITWQCNQCDLDLYAQPAPNTDVLFFAKSLTKEGIYFKDLRRAPTSIANQSNDALNGFETIAFTKPINLEQLRIVVGFYSGNAPSGARGEVRISVDGKTYAKPFYINTTQGTGTASALGYFEKSKASSDIAAINPLDVVSVED